MWTSIVDLSPKRVILTNLLGRFWRGAYFSSFAPLRVQNTPRQPLPGTGWVRVRNRLAGICGSDLHLIYANGDLRVAPAALPGHTHIYLGHEVVGEVIEIGDDVQHLQVGDRVVLQHGVNCLSSGVQPLCRSCASGNYGLCERGTLPGPHPVGGGWSEEMLLHEQQLFRVPHDMTDPQAVLLEPSAVAVHTVLRHIPQPGDRVLVIGAGTIGLLTLQVVRALAPQAEISVQARYPFQVEKATRLGAAHIIYPQDSYTGVQQVTQAQLYTGLLDNKMLLGGYDVIYDTIGTQKTIHNALRWARAKATVVLVGLSLHMMHIDLTPVWYQEINLIGTLGQGMETWPLGTNTQRSTFSITVDMIMNGVLRPEQLITHHFALNNYRQALMTAIDKRDQRAIKVVFDYSLLPASVVPNVRASARHRRQATVDSINASPLVTRDLVQKEPVQPLAEHPVTPMPITPTATPEQSPRVVPAPAVAVHTQPAPNEPEQIPVNEETPVGTDSSRPLPMPPVDEEEQTVDEEIPVVLGQASFNDVVGTTFMASPPDLSGEVLVPHVITETTGDKSRMDAINVVPTNHQTKPDQVVGTDPSRPLPIPTINEDTEVVQEHPVGTDSSRPSDIPTVEEDAMNRSLQTPDTSSRETFDDIPLNDLEWLEVVNAEQEIPEMRYEPDVEDAPPPLDVPPLPEEVWLEEDTALYEEKQQETQDEDLTREEDAAEPRADGEELATNTSLETLLTTKTTKAIMSNKSRSKNRHKGKNTTGSYRS